MDTELPYTAGELKVSGILWDAQGRSSVLINNQVLVIGEFVSGFKVVDIARDSVSVSKDGREYIIRLSIEQKER